MLKLGEDGSKFKVQRGRRKFRVEDETWRWEVVKKKQGRERKKENMGVFIPWEGVRVSQDQPNTRKQDHHAVPNFCILVILETLVILLIFAWSMPANSI